MEIPENVERFCDYIWNRAKELLDEKGYAQSIVFLLKEKSVSMVPAIFESPQEKDSFFLACNLAAKKLEAEAVVMIA